MQEDDTSWLDSAKALDRIGARSDTVLAPKGFDAYFPGVSIYDVDDKLLNHYYSINWFVIFKRQLPLLSCKDVLILLLDSRMIYSNDDFTIFMLPPEEHRRGKWVTSFVEFLL